MAFYIEHRHQGPGKAIPKKASALEIAAEEFLNGLLCHYEPPQNPYELEEEEPESDFHDQLVLRRPPSILKTSRSFEQKRHHNKSGKKGRLVRFSGIHVKPNNKHSSQRPRFGVGGLKKLACRKEKFEF